MVRITIPAYYNSFYCVSIGFSSTFKNPVWIKFMYVKEWSIFYRQELSSIVSKQFMYNLQFFNMHIQSEVHSVICVPLPP